MERLLLQYQPDGDGGFGGGGVAGGGTLLADAPPGGQGQGSSAGQGGQGAGGAPVVQKSFREGWIAPDGHINKANYENLPERLKPYKDVFSRYDTDEELLAAFGHSTTLNGKKGLMPLPKDAPENVKAEFNARLREIQGVPEKPEGYGIKKPDSLPEQLWDGGYVDGVVKIAHKHNVPPAALQELIAYGADYGTKLNAQTEAAQVQGLAMGRKELETLWGAEMPKKLALAERAALSLGLDPKDPSQRDIFLHPKSIQALVKHAEAVSEDRLVNGQSPGAQSMNFRQQALDVVNNQANPMHQAYHDARHPMHSAAIEKVSELNRQFHATQKG